LSGRFADGCTQWGGTFCLACAVSDDCLLFQTVFAASSAMIALKNCLFLVGGFLKSSDF